MRFAFFVHSLISDWNHGNAHFLRGVLSELVNRGHEVRAFERKDAWSLANLLADHGDAPVAAFHSLFPHLQVHRYDHERIDLDQMLAEVDVVVVHEWNEPALVAALGAHRRRREYLLFFHDTHHRIVTREQEMEQYDLSGYDGVLAFGNVIRDLYVDHGWTRRAWTWHEAADTSIFRPLHGVEKEGDLVWIGNWGDGERSDELREFLLEPVRALGLRASVYGVRYPEEAKQVLADAGIEYRGWLPNYRVPDVFAAYDVTVHVPRRPYTQHLPGIPTIRPFEALACGIPLVSAPWEDAEGLFAPGRDYLVARDGDEMRRHLARVLNDSRLAARLKRNGRQAVLRRHTCSHRVEELLATCEAIERPAVRSAAA